MARSAWSNCCVKYYPEGYSEITVFNYPVFSNYVEPKKLKKRKCSSPLVISKGEKQISVYDFLSEQQRKKKNKMDALRRAKNKVFDIALINEWDYFFTLTIDPTKLNRYDSTVVVKAFKTWLKNMASRNGLQYLFVPEYHPNGTRDELGRLPIHFHGLVKGNFDFVDSGKKMADGRSILNVKNWKYGFTTAIELEGSRIAVAKYLTKYITKEMIGILPNMYYAGGGVRREVEKDYFELNFHAIPQDLHELPVRISDSENMAVKYVKFDNEAVCAYWLEEWNFLKKVRDSE